MLSNGRSLGTGSVIDVWFSFTGIGFCEGCDLPDDGGVRLFRPR